jgi:hypothetical protein
MFNKFPCQNKFVIEKHINFVIKIDTHIKFIEQQFKKKKNTRLHITHKIY